MIISHKNKKCFNHWRYKRNWTCNGKAFHNSEASLIITGTKKKPNLREIFGDSHNKICYIQIDFSHRFAITKTLSSIIKNKRIDVLINNAGINRIDSINYIKEDDWDLLNKVNLKGSLFNYQFYIRKNDKSKIWKNFKHRIDI